LPITESSLRLEKNKCSSVGGAATAARPTASGVGVGVGDVVVVGVGVGVGVPVV
jgi:hypothetical protein